MVCISLQSWSALTICSSSQINGHLKKIWTPDLPGVKSTFSTTTWDTARNSFRPVVLHETIPWGNREEFNRDHCLSSTPTGCDWINHRRVFLTLQVPVLCFPVDTLLAYSLPIRSSEHLYAPFKSMWSSSHFTEEKRKLEVKGTLAGFCLHWAEVCLLMTSSLDLISKALYVKAVPSLTAQPFGRWTEHKCSISS